MTISSGWRCGYSIEGKVKSTQDAKKGAGMAGCKPTQDSSYLNQFIEGH